MPMTKGAVREAEGIEGRSGLGMMGVGSSNGFFLQHIRRYGGSPSRHLESGVVKGHRGRNT